MRARGPCGLGLIALLAFSCARPAPRIEAPRGAVRLPESLGVQFRDGGRTVIRRVPIEAYVQGTILSEFAPAAGDVAAVGRMYEVQAVISRTYAAAHLGRHAAEGFDLCATTHCQLFDPARTRTSRWAAIAHDAVTRTAGVVLWFERAPATALYHADCGGRTSDAARVWGGPAPPYLQGVADDGPAAAAHTVWEFEASRDAVRHALNAHPATAVGSRLTGIDVVERDAARRVQRVRLNGQHDRTVRGEDFRAAMTQAFGARSVRSTQFEIRASRDGFVLAGRGFGHGVGLCQAGAYARVRAGTSLRDVLQRYYPGTTLLQFAP